MHEYRLRRGSEIVTAGEAVSLKVATSFAIDRARDMETQPDDQLLVEVRRGEQWRTQVVILCDTLD